MLWQKMSQKSSHKCQCLQQEDELVKLPAQAKEEGGSTDYPNTDTLKTNKAKHTRR